MLSVSSKYAIQALLTLAKHEDGEFVRVEELSRKSKIPGPYLSKIMKSLAQKKIIESRRGISGGVRLPPTKSNLSFYDVCLALNEPTLNSQCLLSKRGCNLQSPCEMHQRWSTMRESFCKFLKDARIR